MMSSSLDAFGKRMDRLAAAYSRTPRDMAAASARAYTTAIRREIGRAAPGGKLRNVGKKGARVGVRYDLSDSPAQGRAFVKATGPLQLIERNTVPHDIPRLTKAKRTRTRGGRVSAKRQDTGIPASNTQVFLGSKARHFSAMGPVHHPGTKGKHPFERGANSAERLAVSDAVKELRQAVAGVFR